MSKQKLTDEQIEKAAKAGFQEFRSRVYKEICEWDATYAGHREGWRYAVRAAAPHLQYADKPLLDEVLGPVTDEEDKQFQVYPIWRGATNRLIEQRRAKLERPKSAEERVTVERMGASEHVFVYVDGITTYQFDDHDTLGDGEKHAEIYRRGLIAQLKEQANG